jgi:KipI family sensor histidine kinase inhibitor
MEPIRIVAAGDAALVVELPQRIDPAINARLVALAETIRERCGSAVTDAVVGYCTLTVYFDPVRVDPTWLEGEMRTLASEAEGASQEDGRRVDVPVCYGGDLGPDLEDVAARIGGSEEEVIALHAGREYRVYVVGFVPGFAYMATVDDRLALPRRSTPRTKVPAGSVAIAAGQTGIYPMETPGGWHILGRTPLKPFDPRREEPVLFKPGDRVRFVPIPRDEYERSL